MIYDRPNVVHKGGEAVGELEGEDLSNCSGVFDVTIAEGERRKLPDFLSFQ